MASIKNVQLVELKGSERPNTKGVLGSADLNGMFTVTVKLDRKRPEYEFRQWLAEIQEGKREPLTLKEFKRLFGARSSDVEKVINYYCSNHGLTYVSKDLAARTVQLRGTGNQMQAAFGTGFGTVKHTDGNTYRVRTAPIKVPVHFNGCVVGVLGLTDIPRMRSNARVLKRDMIKPIGTNPLDGKAAQRGFFTRDVLRSLMIDLGTDGTGESAYILELGGGNSPTDNEEFGKERGLPPFNGVYRSVDGAVNAYFPPNDANMEVELDVQVLRDALARLRIVVGFAPNSDQGYHNGVVDFFNSDCWVLTESWGQSEDRWDPQAIAAMEAALQDCAAIGKIVVGPAGDNNSSDGTEDGLPHLDYLGSSRWVLCVGGYYFEVDEDGKATILRVWNNGNSGTGGGVSDQFPKPEYQKDIDIPRVRDGRKGRIAPDVGAPGDPRSGYRTFVDGAWNVVGGTSAGSPFWAALIAAANARRIALGKRRLYRIHEIIYAIGNLFRHVEEGNNGDYKAEKGKPFNACCGWGAPTQKVFDYLVALP